MWPSSQMAYLKDNQPIPLQPGELAFYYHGDFILANPTAIEKYNHDPSYVPYIFKPDTNHWKTLPEGATFCQMSAVKILGYCSALLDGEQAVFQKEGIWCDICTKEILAWAQQTKADLGVRREGRVDKLPPGSWFYTEDPATYPVPYTYQQPSHTSSLEISSSQQSDSDKKKDAVSKTPIMTESESSSKSLQRSAEESKQPVFPMSQSVPRPSPQDVPTCSTCKTKAEDGFRVFSLWCCFRCLLEQFAKQRFSSPSRSGKCDWNAELIYELWTMLRERLPEETRAMLPQTCPLPLDSVICEGKHIEIKPNYPATGHIVGNSSLCSEGGCPDHPLCRGCANQLVQCPRCSHTITYEEHPDGCPSKCEGSVEQSATFDIPCSSCGRKWERRKQI